MLSTRPPDHTAPLSPATDEDLGRMRAARIANLAAHLEAERRARGLKCWADMFPRGRKASA